MQSAIARARAFASVLIKSKNSAFPQSVFCKLTAHTHTRGGEISQIEVRAGIFNKVRRPINAASEYIV